MSDQVVMSKTNGQLAIAVPLYRMHHDQALGNMEGYTISLTVDKPLAYALDCDEHGITLISADFAKANLEFLGEV